MASMIVAVHKVTQRWNNNMIVTVHRITVKWYDKYNSYYLKSL